MSLLGRASMRMRIAEQLNTGYKGRRVLAVYDLADLPISFDFTMFMVCAENTRRQNNLDKVDVAIIGHDTDPTPPRHSYINAANYRHYSHNVLMEITRLYNFVGSVFFFDNRQQFMDFFENNKSAYVVYPAYYNPLNPVEVGQSRPAAHEWINVAAQVNQDSSLLCIQPAVQQLEVARKWIKKNVKPLIPICLTLRQWEFANRRNTNIFEFQNLIDIYHTALPTLKFIVLPDYYSIYETPITGDNVIYFDGPLTALSLRAALYQECTLNLITSNGCQCLLWLNRNTNYITFKVTAPDRAAWPQDMKRHLGLVKPDHVQGATKYQWLIWEDDTADVMKPHVDRMLDLLEADNKLIPCYY